MGLFVLFERGFSFFEEFIAKNVIVVVFIFSYGAG